MTTNVIFRNVTNTYFDYRREIKKKKNRFKLSAYEKLDESCFENENFMNGLNKNIQNKLNYCIYNKNYGNNTDNENCQIDIELQEDANLLPPYWIEQIEECSELINTIKGKLIELQKLQKKKIINVLSNDEDLSEMISHMSTDITVLIKNCEQKIQNISMETNDETTKENYERSEQNGTQNDIQNNGVKKVIEKLKNNAKHSLASQLQSLSQAFHKKQKKYLKDCQKLSVEYKDIITDYTEENLHTKGTKGNNNIASLNRENGMYENQNQLLYEHVNEIINTPEQELSKRNSDLKRIADTVIELHTIFKELSVMLVEQGSVLDQIDYNIDLTLDKSEHGLKKLKILQKTENDRRAKKCISFLTSLIFVLLILIIIKHIF